MLTRILLLFVCLLFFSASCKYFKPINLCLGLQIDLDTLMESSLPMGFARGVFNHFHKREGDLVQKGMYLT